ncbi:hypothetical protein BEP19_15315 [Ammoniphilus oxalaticus]|uniref:Uncharacterized protein n=1 Tax=Ammoniphilus oxalaticus TaxID=66863 RepID=A0A419SE33_9BACL|nr:hypothetical protein [Ammoniphilus oxalaticus]RKD21143.1 hypothetical protein BEP19_15315 [Ammoniphilus oxalaticus]
MFDPTIFDNLKVVLEGAVYDLDAIGMIGVTNRSDRVDLAHMSRDYMLQFREQAVEDGGLAELRLAVDSTDLMNEILEKGDRFTGCRLTLTVEIETMDPDQLCPRIQETMQEIWENNPKITQRLTFIFGTRVYRNRVTLDFERKINEDLETFVDHALLSLQNMNQLKQKLEGDL